MAISKKGPAYEVILKEHTPVFIKGKDGEDIDLVFVDNTGNTYD